MIVRWLLRGEALRQEEVLDVEQLLFLLRMVGTVSVDGVSYRVEHSELDVSASGMALSVHLQHH